MDVLYLLGTMVVGERRRSELQPSSASLSVSCARAKDP